MSPLTRFAAHGKRKTGDKDMKHSRKKSYGCKPPKGYKGPEGDHLLYGAMQRYPAGPKSVEESAREYEKRGYGKRRRR